MTNNTDNIAQELTIAVRAASREVINRQIEACYALITDYKKDIKRLAFATTEDEMLELADAKIGLYKMEGRVAGLIFARDEVFLPR